MVVSWIRTINQQRINLSILHHRHQVSHILVNSLAVIYRHRPINCFSVSAYLLVNSIYNCLNIYIVASADHNRSSLIIFEITSYFINRLLKFSVQLRCRNTSTQCGVKGQYNRCCFRRTMSEPFISTSTGHTQKTFKLIMLAHRWIFLINLSTIRISAGKFHRT